MKKSIILVCLCSIALLCSCGKSEEVNVPLEGEWHSVALLTAYAGDIIYDIDTIYTEWFFMNNDTVKMVSYYPNPVPIVISANIICQGRQTIRENAVITWGYYHQDEKNKLLVVEDCSGQLLSYRYKQHGSAIEVYDFYTNHYTSTDNSTTLYLHKGRYGEE